MTRYGTLGDYRFADLKEAADDIRGSKVYDLNDEKLGDIDDVIFDQDTGGIVYVVIDTGGWLASKKFVVPPSELRPSVQHRNDYLVELTQEQIESFPPYDGEALSSEDRWADYDRRYRSNWETRPVMHRVATDRNVTPTTKQQIQSGSGTVSSMTDEEAEVPITPITTKATMEVSTAGPSLRWTTFEDRLRQRREEVLESSIRNAKKETGPPASEREREERRKAS
jgi:sporulation protein YlmC with PRC-barrel domain